jgi:hypothetical protein
MTRDHLRVVGLSPFRNPVFQLLDKGGDRPAIARCRHDPVDPVLVARVMSSGGQVAAAIVTVVVAVMVGSGLIGYLFFGERLTTLQIAGYAIAVAGVMVASLAPAAA